MTATLIDGKAISQTLLDEVKNTIQASGLTPSLHVVLVGEDPASNLYVGRKTKAAEAVGIHSKLHRLPDSTSQAELVQLIESLNQDADVHGILVQLPLPKHIDEATIVECIAPSKDVDGFHPYNFGLLAQRRPGLRPCTPHGVIYMLEHMGVAMKGKHAVIVGASNIVGRPMMLELLIKGATTTICNSSTQDLPGFISQADILIVGVGKPELVKGEWVKPGAVVIDVGINRLEDGKIVGDVEFEAARERAGMITPVPGGVGPMTVAMLMQNTAIAAES